MSVLTALSLGVAAFVSIMLFLGALPKLIGMVTDPPRMKRIKQYFESAGCTEIEIKPWPNHYGVRFYKDGVKQYAKCRFNLRSGVIVWVGTAPVGL